MRLFLARNLPSRAIELPANQGSWDENLTCANGCVAYGSRSKLNCNDCNESRSHQQNS
ncbi:hypothetical protein [Tychonema sp. LEGE 07203]|uniref:hypothetical protein n=1 Tax=Tychonema sp. LEGE 07203 TaxID=1828671 RepID=UPI00187EC770|nr:hypothetical protein [Tychonema sp. LEGE 07203]MBE9096835.1 hypothetical protein [Tychonema sp. LEGE 07203]